MQEERPDLTAFLLNFDTPGFGREGEFPVDVRIMDAALITVLMVMLLPFSYAEPALATIGPSITSATYDTSTGVLAVTADGIDAGDTIVVSKLTLTGEGGGTHILTTSNVTASSATFFSVTLNAADQSAVNALLNEDGTAAKYGTTYNLAAADSWDSNLLAPAKRRSEKAKGQPLNCDTPGFGREG